MSKYTVEVEFEARNETFEECLQRVVYGSGRQLKQIAADLDMSPSELSRKLASNPNDPVYFPAKRLDELIEASGGVEIVYWLINRFLKDAEKEKQIAAAELMRLIPKIKPLLEVLENKEVGR